MEINMTTTTTTTDVSSSSRSRSWRSMNDDDQQRLLSRSNNNNGRRSILDVLQLDPLLKRTDIFLPNNGRDDHVVVGCDLGNTTAADKLMTNHRRSSMPTSCHRQEGETEMVTMATTAPLLYIPFALSDSMDACLESVPRLRRSCQRLLRQSPVHYSSHTEERILYVSQGEVAHAVSSQCDIVMSDRATTCHILALKSTSSAGNDAPPPLFSLAHLDEPSYDDCIRAMIQRHKDYHHHRQQEEEPCSNSSPMIQLDVHALGGFDDADSRKMTRWLFTLLAAIAEEYRDCIRLVLQTCAVSCMNDNGHRAPTGRGLAINLQASGKNHRRDNDEVYLAKCDQVAAGPTLALRAARLWSMEQNAPKKLEIIHKETCNEMRIAPFYYENHGAIDTLLALSDEYLVDYTSTSPEIEEETFAEEVRSTLQVMRDVPCERTFGRQFNKSLRFKRGSKSNSWLTRSSLLRRSGAGCSGGGGGGGAPSSRRSVLLTLGNATLTDE